ncbi:hypothetical protein D9613_001474 [Agrocybe pediades]|uniref:Fungal-type protein kinase domain-containing protein n=1 Tax=Agrocybe pediades TaxID=84607 RepID=A0A8H4R6F5_9AGAR|nr:hypothetical protein D9613_001474 [Agrocybe pediades]
MRMDEFIECSFGDFLKSYLPFVPLEEDVNVCLRRLRESTTEHGKRILRRAKVRSGRTKKICECFAEFYQAVNTTERQRLSHLEEIAHAIADSQINGRQLQYTLFSETSAGCHSTDKINACFLPAKYRLRKSGNANKGAVNYLQSGIIPVACSCKLHKSDMNRQENYSQIVSANVQTMNCDSSRIFSFGITIEADEMQLWYFSRSHCAVSERVNFVKNPVLLIKTFVSFMFATKEEMGYDPTITRHDNNKVKGHAPRVWLVHEVASSAKGAKVIGSEYVLEDVWLADSALTEKQIQDAIFESIEGFWSSQERDVKEGMKEMWDKHRELVSSGQYKDFFLTIEADYEGQKSRAAPRHHKRWQSVSSQDDLHYGLGGAPEDHAQKKQYRLIFKEECVRFGELKKLGDAIDVLQQTLIPLELLLCAGWVHRDISSGNILAFEQRNGRWKAKVSDLEYAKKFPRDPESRVDVSTGTPYFMAHEILNARYIVRMAFESDGDYYKSVDNNKHGAQSVIHNFQHDLEPIYWLLYWTLVDRIPHEPSHIHSKEIFLNTVSMFTLRSDAFLDPIRVRLQQALKPSVLFFAKPLDIIRNSLSAACQKREMDKEINDPLSYIKVYDRFSQFFEGVAAGRSDWANEELFSRHEIAKLYSASKERNGGSEGTLSAPRRGKRLRGSRLACPRSPDSYALSEGSEAQCDDSTSALEGARLAKRQRNRG